MRWWGWLLRRSRSAAWPPLTAPEEHAEVRDRVRRIERRLDRVEETLADYRRLDELQGQR